MRNHWLKKQEPHYVYGEVISFSETTERAILLMEKHIGAFHFRHALNMKHCIVHEWIGLTLHDYHLKEELFETVNYCSMISSEHRKAATPISNIEIFVHRDDGKHAYKVINPSIQACQLLHGLTVATIYYDRYEITKR